jgi:hypothetical protein
MKWTDKDKEILLNNRKKKLTYKKIAKILNCTEKAAEHQHWKLVNPDKHKDAETRRNNNRRKKHGTKPRVFKIKPLKTIKVKKPKLLKPKKIKLYKPEIIDEDYELSKVNLDLDIFEHDWGTI